MAPAFALQRLEVRRPVVAGNHRLAVDQERRRLDAVCSVDDGREAIGPVMAVAREDPAAPSADSRMLDPINPERDGGRAAFDGRHGSTKPEGRRTIMAGGWDSEPQVQPRQ
jgi:hypothetical protein